MYSYPHWLDGEILRLKSLLPAYASRKPSEEAIRLLKLYSIFDPNIVLNDVQIIDSRVVVSLFANETFRNFLQNNQTFFKLVGERESDSKTRYQIATSGLRRSQKEGWMSSMFPTPDPIIELAYELLSQGEIEPGLHLEDKTGPVYKVINRWRDDGYAELLEGIVHAVGFFANNNTPIKLAPPRDDQLTFYHILKESVDQELSSQDREYVETTINFIDKHVTKSEDRKYRSNVLKIFDNLKTKEEPELRQTVWHTVVHAWNQATQISLDPDGGSFGSLPRSAPIGAYLDKLTGTIIPLEEHISNKYDLDFTEHNIPWDFYPIPWGEIGTIRHRTEEGRIELANVLKPESSREEIKEKVGTIARIVAGSDFITPPLASPTPYILILGVGVAIILGASGALVPAGTVAAGTFPTAGSIELLRSVIDRSRNFIAARTMTKRVSESLTIPS